MNPNPTPADIETQVTAASDRRTSDWDMHNALRNYSSLVVTQIGSAALSFAAVWLITQKLGSEGYGGIIAIIAASQFAQIFVNWTSIAVVRFGVDEFIETERISRTFWVRSIVFFANFVVVVLLSPLWFPELGEWLKLSSETFWLVLGHFGVTIVWLHIQVSIQAAKMPRMQGLFMMIERLIIFASLYVLTFVGDLTPRSAMLCYIAGPSLLIFVGIIVLRRLIFARFRIDRTFIRNIVLYSAPLAPLGLFGYLGGAYFDAIFIMKFLSLRELGTFAVATQINGLAMQLPTLAGSLMLPLFVTLHYERNSRKLQRYFSEVLPILTVVWALFCTTLAFGGSFLIPLVFGSEFGEAGKPFWLLLVSSAIALPSILGYQSLAQTLSKTYVPMYAVVAAAVINIFLNLWLIPRYGIAGCAAATAISYLAAVLIAGLLLRRQFPISFAWTSIALIPVAISAAILWFADAYVFSFLACIILSVVVILLFRDSAKQAVRFLKSLVTT